MENSEFCVFSLIRCGASVVLVTLTATLSSIIVEIEWEIQQTCRFHEPLQWCHSTCCLPF